MFNQFCDFLNGLLNVFGFNEHKRYGFDRSHEKKKVGLERALEIADLEDILKLIPRVLKNRLEKGKTGFTVVTGEAPEKLRGRNTPRSIIQRLRVHPQARRLLKTKQIFALIDTQVVKLELEAIPAKAGFEGPFEYEVPAILSRGSHQIELANSKYPAGKLVLNTSAEPFTRLGEAAPKGEGELREGAKAGDEGGAGVKAGDEGDSGGGAGDKKKQGPKFPDVRLSDVDSDPLGLTDTVHCDPRHPLIYQRGDDVPEGIYWINTQSPFAKKVLEIYTHEHTRWREYMFQRHIDILVKQSIYEMERREPQLSAARIDNEVLDLVTRRIYEAASEDTSLSSFLFKENLSGIQSVGGETTKSAEGVSPTLAT